MSFLLVFISIEVFIELQTPVSSSVEVKNPYIEKHFLTQPRSQGFLPFWYQGKKHWERGCFWPWVQNQMALALRRASGLLFAFRFCICSSSSSNSISSRLTPHASRSYTLPLEQWMWRRVSRYVTMKYVSRIYLRTHIHWKFWDSPVIRKESLNCSLFKSYPSSFIGRLVNQFDVPNIGVVVAMHLSMFEIANFMHGNVGSSSFLFIVILWQHSKHLCFFLFQQI